MSQSAPYAPVSHICDDDSPAIFEIHNIESQMSDSEEELTEFTDSRSVPPASVSIIDAPDHTSDRRALENRSPTLLDNAIDTKTRPGWQDAVRWCLWGNAAVCFINVVFTATAFGVSRSNRNDSILVSPVLLEGSCSSVQRMKLGLHLLINILSVTMTATSTYCCTILMAPSRADVDNAHLNGTWLSIGVSSYRNFCNLKKSTQVCWILLLLTTMVTQMIYNSVIYSSQNANSYPVIIVTQQFTLNGSVPSSFFEEQTCWPEKYLSWNIAELRSSVLGGSFEYLSKSECIEAYADSYVSDRRTLITVTKDHTIGGEISLAGYGYPGAITALDPKNLFKSEVHDFFALVEGDLDPIGFEWMCYAFGATRSTCSSAVLRSLDNWNVSSQDWTRQTSVHIPNVTQNWLNAAWIRQLGNKNLERDLMQSSKLNWTSGDVRSLLSYMSTNPLPRELSHYLEDTSWIRSAGSGVNISASCPSAEELDYGAAEPLRQVTIDHCLSQRVSEECRLFFHLPIAIVMIICNLVKLACIWQCLHIDRRDLLLTVGDAISSFLQRPDPTTKHWCTLSPETIEKDPNCPWNKDSKCTIQHEIATAEVHPGVFSTTTATSWSKASSDRIWIMTFLILIASIVISISLPSYAVQNPKTHYYDQSESIISIWQIKGWGAIQSTALLSMFASSFVGMELLANTPQLAVSLLYFCLNDTLTRTLLAADYNDFAIRQRPLRVSFPRGQQRSTLYLAIPYRYAVPLLIVFITIHWFISEGLFYVQILPYDIYGKPMESEMLITCAVSTIPLEMGLFLTICTFVVIALLGSRKFKSSAMPLARDWSIIISAACHPPHSDVDAAFKPVQWGVIEQDLHASYPRCSFTSAGVKPPEKDVLYA